MQREQTEERLVALRVEAVKQASFWGGDGASEPKDAVMSAFAEAFSSSLDANPRMQETMGSVLQQRPGLRVPIVFNLAFRCAQKQEMKQGHKEFTSRRYLNNYPLGSYSTPEKWTEVLNRLLDPDSPDHMDFDYDIHNRNLQSTKPQRYIGAVLLRALAVDRIGSNPFVIDVGCSQNLGLKQQALVGELSEILFFDTVKVVPSGIDLGKDSSKWPEDERLSGLVNSLVQNSRPVIGGIGIDIEHMKDIGNQEFAKACSFYPSELIDPGELEAYELLETMPVPSVGFYHEDFPNMDVGKFKDETQIENAGLVTIFTMMNQLNKTGRRKTMAKIEELARVGVVQDDGIVAIEEFAQVNPKSKDQLVINPKGPRKSGEYRLFVRDLSEESGELHHVATFDNGRCNRIQLQPAIGRFSLSHRFGLVA